ncbi:DoxX family membrane protein [Candidatus Falkowbacteria bacterium]|nr:DoxX family membrane protein [Candidatus Falkowbacteria bacterium]
MQNLSEKFVWPLLRILMGWYFLWPFIDKIFGLGFGTPAGKGWLDGVSPTYGFLAKGTKGPFAAYFQALAGNQFVEWLFMIGLLLIGLSLILGIGMRIACFSGMAMMVLFYLAGSIWPLHNPFLDEHIVNGLLLLGLLGTNSNMRFGFGAAWTKTKLVKRYPILQ